MTDDLTLYIDQHGQIRDKATQDLLSTDHATRVVACVNAMKGVATADLEHGTFKAEIATVMEYSSRLEKAIKFVLIDGSSQLSLETTALLKAIIEPRRAL